MAMVLQYYNHNVYVYILLNLHVTNHVQVTMGTQPQLHGIDGIFRSLHLGFETFVQ